ncbi:MAG: sulfatase-like hydrolase/transferase [Phycisphaerae bacterium]|nr:sulfatase-like hydrolase/transferase [Phycisphaerae bacterium]
MEILSRRDFLRLAGLAPFVFSGCSAAQQQFVLSNNRPNIVILYADDMRHSTLGCLGYPVRTPNLDKLAARGTIFTRAHIMGGMQGAICIPSRAMLLTGRTLFHLQKDGRQIPESDRFLGQTLADAGYDTYGVGKWHSEPAAFNRAFAGGTKIFFGGMSDQYKVPVQEYDPTGKYPKERQTIGEKPSSELFADAAIGYLRGRPGDKPFFLYVAFTSPHDPRTAPPEYAKMYPPESIELPPNFLPQHPFDNGEMKVRDELLASFPRDPADIRKQIGEYYAMITHLDAQVGRILRALDETGRTKDTIVIFAGDNGLAVGQHGLMGKQNLYEHSVRVPLMMAGPNIPVGQRRDGFCYLLDIYPTICEILRISKPANAEGISMVPMLSDSNAGTRETMFYAYRNLMRGFCDGRYKLIEYTVKDQRHTQLFDLQNDPWEMKNRADDPEFMSHRDRLGKWLQSAREKYNDPTL